MDESAPMIPLGFTRLKPDEMRTRAKTFLERAKQRRSVREFSRDPIPMDVVEDCITAAATAPSGANKQPWAFVLITDPEVKRAIREAAEKEEEAFYGGRASDRWLRDLEPFATGPEKPFLENAPALIVVFAQRHGNKVGDRHYYVSESVGIAVGVLIAALNEAGLATLTHTPSPMRFLSEVLGRPKGEQPYVLIPVGYPTADCVVPDITRKPLDDVLIRKGE